MDQLLAVTSMALVCLFGSALSQMNTRCYLSLRHGGQCVEKKQDCPTGSFEYEYLSNFVGCFMTTQKCCAYTQDYPVVNPDGIVPEQKLTCGLGSLDMTNDRVLDGLLTGVCDWPFVVSIRALLRTSDQLTYAGTSHACAGVLIDTQWVLTSPFCIFSAGNNTKDAPSRILVVAGEYNVSGIDINPLTGEQQEQFINVEKVYLNPGYAYSSQDEIIPFFDDITEINSDGIALIKLSQPIVGRCSGIICLPSIAEAANDCASYDECVITGWGFEKASFTNGLRDELLLGRVRLTSQEACSFLTERLGLASVRPRGSICQSPRFSNTDSCLGDEGGAVMCSNGYNWVVRGILPFNMCVDGKYNLYVTDVATYLDWIQETMAL